MVEPMGDHSDSASSSPHPLTIRRKALYAGLTIVLLMAIAEVVLSLVGVEPGVALEDPFVGFKSNVPLFLPGSDNSGKPIYRTAPNKRQLFNDQQFSEAKETGTYRIFCLGGSTTYGRPYRDATSFVGWLRTFLNAAAPEKRWEVINCGGVSYASYRVAALMTELIKYDPDLFIVYSGHNEFLERRTYAGLIDAHPVVGEMQLLLHRSRTVTLIRRTLSGLLDDPREAARRKFHLSGEVSALLDTSAGLELYHRDENFRKQVIAHYRFNLGRMVTLARSVGADVVFIQPAANIKDFSPFKNEHRYGLSDEDLATWRALYEDAVQMTQAESMAGQLAGESALDLFDRAARLDDRYAELHYARGRVLFQMGRFDEAKSAFATALAEDVCPLRMLPSMHDVLTTVADAYHVPLVDFFGKLQLKCLVEFGHTLPGNEYFLDHVHPTIETNYLLGRILLDHLFACGVAEPSADWNETTISSTVQTVMESLNERDHALARSMLGRVLRWAGKTEEAERLIAGAMEMLPDDAATVSSYARTLKLQGKSDEAILYYRRALELEPGLVEASVNLANLLLQKGLYEEAIAHYAAILEQRPEDALATGRLAVALSEAGRIAEGESAFLRALRLDPDNPTILTNFGQSLIKQGRFEEARARFSTVLQRHPRTVRAWILKGVALMRMDRVHEAFAHYDEALRLDPNSAQAHYNLGVAFLMTGKEDRAIPHFERAVEADPRLVDAHFSLGQAFARRGEYDRARRHLERVLALTPDDPRAYLQLGIVLMADGLYAECIGVLRKGILIAPDDIDLVDRLVWVLATAPNEDVRDGTEAVRLAERLEDLPVGASVTALDSLAAAYAETQRFDDACDTIERAIKMADERGKHTYAIRLRKRLEQYRRRQPFRLREHRR